MQEQIQELTESSNSLNGSKAPLGEFTRRKNWSQSVLDSVRDVLHVLSKDLQIVYSSDASSEILGYKASELVGHPMTEFIHVDDVDVFVREFRQGQNGYQTLRTCFRFLRKDGKYATLETRGQFHQSFFFGNARRMPTEASKSIDTLLDLKMENELLKRQLELLKDKSTESRVQDPSSPSVVYTQGVEASYGVAESLSLFTGLHFDQGERSEGLLTSELKTMEDNPKKRAHETSENKKICDHCGTVEAPEWRKGPNGPKTLCNACGLRWSKKQKTTAAAAT
ncbi:hypothetical protein BY458DRAFT_527240 [Sporodiniella umbellata]|nr:hypothetical protein BY458DRAFT_527240 [Sporodiniella umbellata]